MTPNSGRRSDGLARLVDSLDRSLVRLAASQLAAVGTGQLRRFWLDGLVSTISVSLYASFVPLSALAYGANNVQIGQLTAAASLVAQLPGAEAIPRMGGRRKAVVVLFGGSVAAERLRLERGFVFVTVDDTAVMGGGVREALGA
jgi:hypothetical protein